MYLCHVFQVFDPEMVMLRRYTIARAFHDVDLMVLLTLLIDGFDELAGSWLKDNRICSHFATIVLITTKMCSMDYL